jgi:hypothetical protein
MVKRDEEEEGRRGTRKGKRKGEVGRRRKEA